MVLPTIQLDSIALGSCGWMADNSEHVSSIALPISECVRSEHLALGDPPAAHPPSPSRTGTQHTRQTNDGTSHRIDRLEPVLSIPPADL